jgi:hypothetical protein
MIRCSNPATEVCVFHHDGTRTFYCRVCLDEMTLFVKRIGRIKK